MNRLAAIVRRSLMAVACLGLGLVIGLGVAGRQPGGGPTPDFLTAVRQSLERRTPIADRSIFERVWELIEGQYIEQPVDRQRLFYGAVAGLVDVLGDRYSSFFDPQAAADFKSGLGEAAFEGIGAELGARGDDLVIIAPLPESPAERAGLKPNDRILQIDGELATDLTVDQAVQRIRGQQGTTVELTILSSGEEEPRVVSITRDRIQVKSVRWEMKTSPAGQHLAYVRLSHFTDETGRLFQRTVQELLLKQPAGVILDLRNNPGGFLEAAVDVASDFLEPQTPVLIETRVGGASTVIQSSQTPLLKGLETVILVNQGTASASEILAGALQDYGVAIVVGEQTFGKGSVQSYEEFPDGSSFKLTIARWSTPNGRSIDASGIAPTITVADKAEGGEDPVLERAFKVFDAS